MQKLKSFVPLFFPLNTECVREESFQPSPLNRVRGVSFAILNLFQYLTQQQPVQLLADEGAAEISINSFESNFVANELNKTFSLPLRENKDEYRERPS